MADIAARREARRRRILENSESRLQRISGQLIKDNNIDKENSLSVTNTNSTNGILPNELLINSQSRNELSPLEIDDDGISVDLEPSVVKIKRENNCNDNGIIHGDDQIRNYTGEDFDSSRNLQYSKQNVTSEIEENNEVSILNSTFVNRSVYIILAAIMNLMLVLRMENLFGRSVIVPFLLISLGRLWIVEQLNKNQRNNTANSMIFAALILCNVRPKLIYTFKKILHITNQLINDLATFIFSFIFMYLITTTFINDYDLSLANKVEIVIDNHHATT